MHHNGSSGNGFYLFIFCDFLIILYFYIIKRFRMYRAAELMYDISYQFKACRWVVSFHWFLIIIYF